MEAKREPAEEQETSEVIQSSKTSCRLASATKSTRTSGTEESLMVVAYRAMLREDAKKHPQKVRSKKKRRASAKAARHSRKQNR